MSKFIALLRGVNVGGKNKISMAELKGLFEENGFTDVATYINSGNMIFSSENTDIGELKTACEALIFQRFGLNIAVAIISAADLSDALTHAPAWWGHDQDAKHNAIFVIAPTTAEEVCKNVGEIKPEYEQIGYWGSVIFWSAPIKTFSMTRWSKVVGTSLYDRVTIRNANTAIKLLQLVTGDL